MVDRIQQAKDLLIEQYKKSPNLNGLIGAATAQLQTLDDESIKLINDRTLETAKGVNLDVIGKIVVLDRPFTDPDPEEVFTFENPGGIGGGFTNVAKTQQGGYYIGLEAIDNQLYSDTTYRFILRAKIIFNTTKATLKDMHAYASFVFGTETIITERIGAIDVNIARPLGKQERQIIQATFPKAAGIRLGYLAFSLDSGAFGFAGDERNGGFGDATDSEIGGGFSSLIID